jgi:hypothetical protein
LEDRLPAHFMTPAVNIEENVVAHARMAPLLFVCRSSAPHCNKSPGDGRKKFPPALPAILPSR